MERPCSCSNRVPNLSKDKERERRLHFWVPLDNTRNLSKNQLFKINRIRILVLKTKLVQTKNRFKLKITKWKTSDFE